MYYKDYASLEIHFAKSHYICPYEECKQKCYVAFQTENEVKTHLEILHSRNKGNLANVNASALLGFRTNDEHEEETVKRKVKEQKQQLKDKEGIDFKYYFTQKYQMVH
jgi:hypothetical protein